GGDGAHIVAGMTASLASSGNIAPYGAYYVFGITPIPLPTPHPSAIGFSPATLDFSQNVGSTGTQTMTITNFGGSSLNLGGISASGPFGQTNNCSGQLAVGASCSVTVTFTPTAPGSVSGTLAIGDDSGNMGSLQTVVLTGTGTTPAASVSPASLSFQSTVLGATSSAR